MPKRPTKVVTEVVGTGGPSVLTLTFVVLLVMKLMGWISISWWWVTAPLWGPFAVVLSGLLLFLLGVCAYFLIGSLKIWWKNYEK